MAYNYLSKANIKSRNRKTQDKWDNFGKLNPEEREIINKTYSIMSRCVSMLQECQDIYISDLRELDIATYKLKNIWAIDEELESLDNAEE